MDNANIHHGGKVARFIEKTECHLLYLPPYSPDFNPIEFAWTFVNKIIRRIGPRDDGVREHAFAQALVQITDTLAKACSMHYEYHQAN